MFAKYKLRKDYARTVEVTVIENNLVENKLRKLVYKECMIEVRPISRVNIYLCARIMKENE